MKKIRKNQKEVSISCNCADKAKMTNRFSITFFKETFKKKLFIVSQMLAKTLIELHHSINFDILSVFATIDMLLTGLL